MINFHQSAQQISAFVRALSPDLGAITFWKNKVRYKWFQVVIGIPKELDHNITYAPGTIVEINRRGFIVACREGFIQVLELQKAGKKKAVASTYQNLTVGD